MAPRTKKTVAAAAPASATPSSPVDPRDAMIDKLSAMLATALGGVKPTHVQPNALYVGIRNVSSDTLGIPAQFGEPALTLHPSNKHIADPYATAVITYPRWQALRRGGLYDLGLIVRDDSILGEVHTRAPDDRPDELAPNHAKNLVIDPDAFITGQSEADLRAKIGAMTSEQSLRRLWRAVDDKISEALKGVDRKNERAQRAAVDSLPAAYQLAERLVVQRLDEINPKERV